MRGQTGSRKEKRNEQRTESNQKLGLGARGSENGKKGSVKIKCAANCGKRRNRQWEALKPTAKEVGLGLFFFFKFFLGGGGWEGIQTRNRIINIIYKLSRICQYQARSLGQW